jgi:hypothetical protein
MSHLFSHVTGESLRNDDGTDRQAIIASCRVGAPLRLEAKPANPAMAEDEISVLVLCEDGQQIGYLERDLAARIANHLRNVSAFVACIRRRSGSPDYGLELLIVVTAGQSAEVVEAYAHGVLAVYREIPPRRSRPPSPQSTTADPTAETMLLGGMSIIVGVIALIAVLIVEW